MDTFGTWLRQQRSQLKLTREQFAELHFSPLATLKRIGSGLQQVHRDLSSNGSLSNEGLVVQATRRAGR